MSDLVKVPIGPLLQNNWQRSPFENPHTTGLYRATFPSVIAHYWVTCNLFSPGQKIWAYLGENHHIKVILAVSG